MKNKSGIYLIENIKNGKKYIGQSICVHTRKINHFTKLSNGNHHCKHLQNSFNKYGSDTFLFRVIEFCDIKVLTEREQYWMDVYNGSLYNSAVAAGSNAGTKFSIEARNNMSIAAKGKILTEEHRKKISLSLKGNKRSVGRKITESHKNIISESLKGNVNGNANKGIKLSDEHKRKIALALTGKKASQETRDKLSKARFASNTEENKRRVSETLKKKWADPEFKEYMLKNRIEKKLSNNII